MNIVIGVKKLQAAITIWGGDEEIIKAASAKGAIGFDTSSAKIDLAKCPHEFLTILLDDGTLSDKQRDAIFVTLNGVAADTDMLCSKAQDVQNMITSLKLTGEFNAEWQLGSFWYPIRLTSSYSPARDGFPAHCTLTAKMRMVDRVHEVSGIVSSYDFKHEDGSDRTFSGKEMLAKLGFRFIQGDIAEFKKLCSLSDLQAQKIGHLVASVGDLAVYKNEATMYGYSQQSLGTTANGSKDVPKKVVIEPALEGSGRNNHDSMTNVTNLPLVRVFSLELKRYAYSDVRDIQPYEFEKDCIDNLVLPKTQKELISKLFQAKTSEMFGDILKDKHGGMIILANGGPGTGKTLTAEVFAEMTERPLYVMEMCELGVNVDKMEENLSRVFTRVTRWGAVLLFDEADVFLAERGEDLQRAVIVGIFLRLMDYYHGLLFLTSNRAEKIDSAFKSRITIQLNYPDHTVESRQEVWSKMFAKAGVKCELNGIASVELNGRHIRNMVRLVRVLHGTEVTSAQLHEVCKFACT